MVSKSSKSKKPQTPVSYDPNGTLDLLNKWKNPSNNNKINSDNQINRIPNFNQIVIPENDDGEYEYVITDPQTGENIKLAVGDLPSDLDGRPLFFDPQTGKLVASDITNISSEDVMINVNSNNDSGGTLNSGNETVDNSGRRKIPLIDGYIHKNESGNGGFVDYWTPENQMNGDGQLQNILNHIVNQVRVYNYKAIMYQYLNLFITSLIVLGATYIGFYEGTRKNGSLAVSIISFVVAALKTLHSVTKLAQMGVTFKYYSLRLQSTYRNVQEAKDIFVTDEEKKHYAHMTWRTLTQTQMETFRASYGSNAFIPVDSIQEPPRRVMPEDPISEKTV